MPNPAEIHIPDPYIEDVDKLLDLEASKIDTLADVIYSKETLHASDSPYKVAAQEADIDHSVAVSILNVVANVTKQMDSQDLSSDEVLDDILSLTGRAEEEIDDDKKAALINIFSKTDEGYIVENAQRLKLALLPHLYEVNTICDIRPIFDESHDSIQGAITIVLLEMTIHDENHEDEKVVVQLEPDELAEIKEVIEDAEHKVELMRDTFSESTELFN